MTKQQFYSLQFSLKEKISPLWENMIRLELTELLKVWGLSALLTQFQGFMTYLYNFFMEGSLAQLPPPGNIL